MGWFDRFRKKNDGAQQAGATGGVPSSAGPDAEADQNAARGAHSGPGDTQTSAELGEAPGWDAISAACDATYPDQPDPIHYGTLVKFRFGGPDPLDGVSIYRAAEPEPHWHYVSYGLSDLYGEGRDAFVDAAMSVESGARSGYGIELTFRLADPAALDPEAQPPTWPVVLMQNLARYVFGTGNVVRPGHHMDLNGSIAAERDTALTAVLFAEDPDLGTVATPLGEVTFVQIVGVTAEDLVDATAWRTASFLALLDEAHPRGVTHLERGSLSAMPGMVDRIAAGQAADGSSTGYYHVDTLEVLDHGGTFEVVLPPIAVEPLRRLLATRLAHGRPAALYGPAYVLELAPAGEDGPAPAVFVGGDSLGVTVTDDVARELDAALGRGPGSYPLTTTDVVVTITADEA